MLPQQSSRVPPYLVSVGAAVSAYCAVVVPFPSPYGPSRCGTGGPAGRVVVCPFHTAIVVVVAFVSDGLT